MSPSQQRVPVAAHEPPSLTHIAAWARSFLARLRSLEDNELEADAAELAAEAAEVDFGALACPKLEMGAHIPAAASNAALVAANR